MKIFKTVLCLVLSLLLAVGIFGCSNSNSSQGSSEVKKQDTVQSETQSTSKNNDQAKTENGDKVQVRFAAHGGDEINTYKKIAETFNGKNGNIEIVLELIPGETTEYHNKILAEIASDNAPDIVRQAEVLGPKGLFLNVKDRIDKDIDKSKYTELLSAYARSDGGIDQVALAGQAVSIWYNKDLLKKEGISLPSPDWSNSWTWDDIYAIAKKVSKGDGINRIYGFAAEYMLVPQYRLDMLLHTNGTSFYANGDYNTCNTNDPKAIKVLGYFEKMIKEKLTPNLAILKVTPIDQLFKEGKIAIGQFGTWMSGAFKDLKFEVGFAPIPKGPDANKAVTELYAETVSILKDSKNPDAAWEVMKYYLGEEAQTILLEGGMAGVVVNRAAVEKNKDSFFTALKDDKEKLSVLQGYDNGYLFYYHEKFAEFSKVITDKNDLFSNGQITAEQYGTQVTDGVNKILKK